MAHSLEQSCTALKLEYDSCFNSWFEGYLEPAVSASASPESRSKYSKEKADEYERKCGKIWASYRDCVRKAVKVKGLDGLLDQARQENPLKEPPQMPRHS